jgi:hypothetical protein
LAWGSRMRDSLAVDVDAAGDELAEDFVFAAMVDGEDLRDSAVGGQAEFEEVGLLERGGAAKQWRVTWRLSPQTLREISFTSEKK